MSLRFVDETRLLTQAKELSKTTLGKLRLWHLDRYKPHEGVAFEDRTPGDLLEEFYLTIAAEIDTLSGKRADLEADELERLLRLEEVLEPEVEDRTALRGLSAEESEEVYSTAHKTGDPMADYWEYRISRGLSVDLEIEEVPPRAEWSTG